MTKLDREWGVSSAEGIVPFSDIFVLLSSDTHAFKLCANKSCPNGVNRIGRPVSLCSANRHRHRIGDYDYLKLPNNGELLLHHLKLFGQSVRSDINTHPNSSSRAQVN